MKLRFHSFVLPLFLFTMLLASAPTLADVVQFPTFGVAFSPPADTSFDVTNSPGCVGLYRFTKTSEYPGAALLVEWIPAGSLTADQIADKMVKKFGATLDPGSFTIGGEKAVRVSSPYPHESFTNRVTYIVVHGRIGYMISAMNTKTSDASKPLTDFLPSVTFSTPQSPAKQTELLNDIPTPIFGTFTMKIARSARVFDDVKGEFNFGLNDLSGQTTRQPFSVDIRAVKMPGPIAFATIRDQYSAVMAKKFNLAADKQLTWTTSQTVPGLCLTEPVIAEMPLPNGKTSSHQTRIAILELAPGDMVQFIFTNTPTPEDEAAVYLKMSTSMLDTIKTVPPVSK